MTEISKSSTGCSGGLNRIFSGTWHGTVRGCNCLHVNYCWRRGVSERTLSTGSCNYNETRCGCLNVAATPRVDLWKFPGEDSYCAKRESSMSFKNVYKNMHRSGECRDGFKKCGNVNGKSKGICIADSSNCPINDVQFGSDTPDASNYEKIDGNSVHLFYSRKLQKQPLVDLILSENGVCLSTEVQSLSPGRTSYKLREVDGDSDCKRDTRYSGSSTKQAGEQDLFNLNGVFYQFLPAFHTSNTYKWSANTRSIIEFSPACLDIVPTVFEGGETLESLSSRFDWCLVIFLFKYFRE